MRPLSITGQLIPLANDVPAMALLMLSLVWQAAVRDEQWSLASRLFDEAEKRHMSGHHDRGRSAGTSGDIADGDKSQRLAGPPRASDARSYDRGRRELRKTAIDTMAPTALTYRLALQVGRVNVMFRAYVLHGNGSETVLVEHARVRIRSNPDQDYLAF